MYSYRSRWKWSMVVSFHLRLTWPSLCIPPLRLYPSGQRHSLDHRTPAPTPAHTNNQCEAISSNTTCRHFFNLYGLSQFGLHIIANSLVYQIKPIPSLILMSLWKKGKSIAISAYTYAIKESTYEHMSIDWFSLKVKWPTSQSTSAACLILTTDHHWPTWLNDQNYVHVDL